MRSYGRHSPMFAGGGSVARMVQRLASLVGLAMQAISFESRRRAPVGTGWRKDVVGGPHQLDAQHLLSQLCCTAMPTLEKAVASATSFLSVEETELLRSLNAKAGVAKHRSMGKTEVCVNSRRQNPRVAVERLANASEISAQAAATALGAWPSHAVVIATALRQAVVTTGTPREAQSSELRDWVQSTADDEPSATMNPDGESSGGTTDPGSFSGIDEVSVSSEGACCESQQEVIVITLAFITPLPGTCEAMEPDGLDLWFADNVLPLAEGQLSDDSACPV